MKEVKPAATILLGRDNDGDFEVLLLRRNKALAFAGGLWVFPGGKIEPEEKSLAKDDLEAAKLAAVRETKEEANLDISTDALIFYRHWTTPVVEPRRYATWFFFADANRGDTEVTIDDSEIKEHLWINPQEALDRFGKGEMAMLPPTFMSLQLIRKCKSVEEALELMIAEDPIFILPVLQQNGTTMTVLYEGDAGYESGDFSKKGAKHRLSIDMIKGKALFEYENCDFPPVNGGNHL